jgi:tetratricopeptide (TPR) repeat protein
MGHLAGSLRAERPLSRRPRGYHWTAVGLAFCAIATAGTAGAQGIWDDPAFALYRQAVEAMDRKDYAKASELSGQAVAQQPTHVLAHYLRGQAAMFQSRWEDAAAAFGKAVELYPGSFAAQRDLGGAHEQLNRVDEAARAYEKSDLPSAEKSFTRAATLRDEGRAWFNLGVVRTRLNDLPGALQAYERAAQHSETREPAQKEVAKVREAMKGPSTGTAPDRAMPGSAPGQPVPTRRY